MKWQVKETRSSLSKKFEVEKTVKSKCGSDMVVLHLPSLTVTRHDLLLSQLHYLVDIASLRTPSRPRSLLQLLCTSMRVLVYLALAPHQFLNAIRSSFNWSSPATSTLRDAASALDPKWPCCDEPHTSGLLSPRFLPPVYHYH